MLYIENTKVIAEKIVNGGDFDKKIDPCLASKNFWLKFDIIYLLIRMLDNENTKFFCRENY